jgi:hypothetical protein
MPTGREATVRTSLQINNTMSGGEIQYYSRPTSFQAAVDGNNGPTPGVQLAALDHTAVNFAELTSYGGFCRMQNLDPLNIVHVGVRDNVSGLELFLMELLPGESYVIRLSSLIGGAVTGTGTVETDATSVILKATGAPCRVLVEAFDP